MSEHTTAPQTESQPRLDPRLSCSTVCFRDRTLAAALATIDAMGFGSADLSALAGLCEHIPPKAEPELLEEASRALRASRLEFVSINADTGSFNGAEDPQVVLSRVEALSRFAREHGIPRLVLTCGEPEQPDAPVIEQIAAVAHGLNRAADLTARHGVQLCVEAPHYFRLVNTRDRVAQLVAMLDPRVQLIYDTSHVRAAGQEPAHAFTSYADRIALVHLRDAIDGDIRKVIGAGDIDFEGFIATAMDRQYDGRHVLELETHASPFATKDEEVADALMRLQPIFATHPAP